MADSSLNINNLVRPMLTDKYQVTMCYAYWRNNRHESPAVFDLYFRKNPFKGEYTIYAGVGECLKFLKNYKFTKNDINYLMSNEGFANVPADFWIYLESLNTKSIKIYSLQEGSVCFPNCPLLRIEGPLGLLQLVETPLLNLINYASLMATNAARFRVAANSGTATNCKLLEFGLRRAQGPDGGFSASRYAYLGGFDATSNLLAGMEFNIPVSGTMGHSLITSYFGSHQLSRDRPEDHKFLVNKLTNKEENFTLKILDAEQEYVNSVLSRKGTSDHRTEKSELRAFAEFAYACPHSFLALVDTYDVIRSGLVNFCIIAIALIRMGYKPLGIRIDSGDLAYLSLESRSIFSLVANVFKMDAFNNLDIIASNDINEETIQSFRDQDHAITSLGIGTHLVTCQGQPALGCIYKLVEVGGSPCMKLSSVTEKATIPGRKCAYRLYGQDGFALLDLITIGDEPAPVPGQRILCRHPFDSEQLCYAIPARVEALLKVCWDGDYVGKPFGLEDARAHCQRSLNYVTNDIKRSLNPTPYKVSVSEALFKLLSDLKLRLKPIVELS